MATETITQHVQPIGSGAFGKNFLELAIIGVLGYFGYEYGVKHHLISPLFGHGTGATPTTQGTGGTTTIPTTTIPTSTPAGSTSLAGLYTATPATINTGGHTAYFYAGLYPGQSNTVAIAKYAPSGQRLAIYAQPYSTSLSQQLGSVATGVYEPPGSYTIP